MGGFNRDIGVGIAIALDGKIIQKLRQPLNAKQKWVYAKPIRFPIRANKPVRYIGNV
jgi:hypothetical protein